MRRLVVNGTAKVYFVEEKAGCHATIGPHGGDTMVLTGPAGPRGLRLGKRNRVGETWTTERRDRQRKSFEKERESERKRQG